MAEVKQCPVCWGKKVVCVGLKENLEPILEPCTGCDGTGWIAFKYVDESLYLTAAKERIDLILSVLKRRDKEKGDERDKV